MNRRKFNLGLTAIMLSLTAIPKRLRANPLSDAEKSDRPATPSGAIHSSYFFKHPTFEYVFLVSLGRAYQMAGNVGKVLYLSKQIEDGNFESAYQVFRQAADEARGIAEESASQGHKESARQAYLWAQNFYDSSTYFVDNSKEPAGSCRPGSAFTTAGSKHCRFSSRLSSP